MRMLTLPIVIGPLMLAGVLPAAGQANSPGTPIQSTANSNSTADRDTYTQKVRDEMRDWRRKLTGAGEAVKADGREAGAATGNELNAAWIETKAEEHKLRIATAQDWELAKASFEKADHELTVAWDKARPPGK